jgi:hypothetical protein
MELCISDLWNLFLHHSFVPTKVNCDELCRFQIYIWGFAQQLHQGFVSKFTRVNDCGVQCLDIRPTTPPRLLVQIREHRLMRHPDQCLVIRVVDNQAVNNQ